MAYSLRPNIKNTGRFFRVRTRIRSYARIAFAAWRRGIPLKHLLRTQFPHQFRTSDGPTVITIELTNNCDLKCGYCSSPLIDPIWRGFISQETVESAVRSLPAYPNARVRLVGHGEPTLHPRFAEFSRRVARSSRFVSITTNGQWRKSETVTALVEAPFDLIEISVDAGTGAEYEAVRCGASHERLIGNLIELRRRRNLVRGRRPLINIRLMVRPSQKSAESHYRRFWSDYADTVMPQYIVERDPGRTVGGDAFQPATAAEGFARCAAALKAIIVGWNGEIQFCKPVGIVGNVNRQSLETTWQNGKCGRYRLAQSTGDALTGPLCVGCTHAT